MQDDQLKERTLYVNYLNRQINALYQKYLLSTSENRIFEDRIQELEDELAALLEEHRLYCQQLKKRCKDYVMSRIQDQGHYRSPMTKEISESIESVSSF